MELSMAPGFTMSDIDITMNFFPAVLISLPTYASIANIKFRDIPYERLVLRLKEIDNE